MHKYYLVQLGALLIFFCLGALSHDTYLFRIKHEEQVRSMRKYVEKLRSEIVSAHKNEVKLNNSLSVLQEFNRRVRPDNHRGESVSLDSMIRQLCALHRVVAEDIKISNPIDVSEHYDKRYIKVSTSNVRIKFAALTDKHAVLLMQAIKYDVPGFIAMKLFEVHKDGEITPEVISAHRQGELKTTVSGTIVFDLYDISGKYV
ncbi:hypothetical protein ANPL_03840 [Anaplasma platys]|uniref:Uncharacterized protein n=1 Tax=Anaplasma platys TaxID=949 RepID=A0A858PZ44_9RICK|nr:hypothetical protein [Anaplasma platys]QJC27818.1 hypothetical protein ANPL_03840 [Anaplasma platys]